MFGRGVQLNAAAETGRTPTQALPLALEFAALVLIVLVAAFLRLYQLDITPPGLHYDEAAYGLLARETAETLDFKVFYRAYAGREPIFIYLVALSTTLLGPTVFAIRVVAALVGVSTVLAAYLFARRPFGPATALAGSAMLAVLYWHVHTSRLGFRAILVPLLLTITLAVLWHAVGTGRARWYVIAGIFGGLTFYTYNAARFAAVLTVAFVLLQAVLNRRWLLDRWRKLGLAALALAVVVTPLALYFAQYPDDFFIRASQTTFLSPQAIGGNPLATLAESTWRTLAMFSYQGDLVTKYNLPGKPVFDLAASALFYAGILVAFANIRKPQYVLLLAWSGTMLLPSATTTESPHFMRTLGAAPAAALLVGVGMVAAVGWVDKAARGLTPAATSLATSLVTPLAVFMAGVFLVAQGALTYRDYFLDWAKMPQVYYAFETDIAQEADFARRTLQADPGAMVYASAEHYRHPSVAYLAPEAFPKLKWFDGRETVVFSPGPAVYLIPRSASPPDWRDPFPKEAIVERLFGPDGIPSFTAYRIERAEVAPPRPLKATFGSLVEFLGYDTSPEARAGESAYVALYWRVLAKPQPSFVPSDGRTASYSAFIHLVDSKGRKWGQRDPSSYLGEQWEPGETVVGGYGVPVDVTTPPGEYSLEVGFYDKATGEALPVVGDSVRGQALDLGKVRVLPPTEPFAADKLPIARRVDTTFGDIALLGAGPLPKEVRQGDAISIDLYWRALGRPTGDFEAILQLEDRSGQVRQEWATAPVDGRYPTGRWQPEQIVRDRQDFTVGPLVAPGTYTLKAGLRDADKQLLGPAVAIGGLNVAARARRFEIPSISHPQIANLGQSVSLLGYDLLVAGRGIQLNTPTGGQQDPVEVKPGDTLSLILYWQAKTPIKDSYTVFTHLLDTNSRVRGQKDSIPGAGTLPTSGWVENEVISDRYEIAVEPAAPSGRYQIEVGMYLASTGERLPTGTEGNRILLDAAITVR